MYAEVDLKLIGLQQSELVKTNIFSIYNLISILLLNLLCVFPQMVPLLGCSEEEVPNGEFFH